MPCAARRIDPTLRRSARIQKTRVISVIYSDDDETDSSTSNPVKTEIIDSEEIASPSPSEPDVASDDDSFGEPDFHNVSLKHLRAQCKVKNKKAPKTISEGSGNENQSQSADLQDEMSKDEVDLDVPLIALKLKKPKAPPCKAKGKVDAPSSPYATRLDDTPSKGDETNSLQTVLPESTLYDSTTEKLERRAVDPEHSRNAIEHTEEIAGEDIYCAETENTIFGNINAEDIDTYKEVGISSCGNSYEHLSVELPQVPIEDDGSGQQPGFITQSTESDVSDAKAHLDGNIEQKRTDNNFSSLDLIDEVSNHQKLLDDTSNSDMNKSSIGNELFLSSVHRSCDDHTDNYKYRYTEVVQGNTAESIKTVQESSPIHEFNTDMRCTSVVMQPDSCGGIDRIGTSLEEVVQMPLEVQLDSLVCHGVRTKGELLHMNVEQAAIGYNFAFDKTLDLCGTANFDTQDGRLESIVYDALNNHVQRKSFETKTTVIPDTDVVTSSPIVANLSHDGHLLLASSMEGSSKDMNQLCGTVNVDIRRSVNDQESTEAYDVQHQLFQACVNMGETGGAISDSSCNLEETKKNSAGASCSSATCLETNGHIRKSEFFIDEESIEDHTPKKLLSKRKIMSPTSQEKLCNALTDIDLCGVQRLKRKINLEDCDKGRQALPQTANKQDQSILTTNRRLKGRTSISFTSKGEVAKPTESTSPQLSTCACMRSSSVLLDTEKAVEFSQRQMHDMETIAANLIRSLKHMRSLVDESLSSETHSLLPNFNTAEIRAASEDALEVERTTRKWLAIMNKDCNRFCKILTLAGKKAVSHPEVPRKRRKITFADEAGGALCHVKVFNDGQTSFSECQGEL